MQREPVTPLAELQWTETPAIIEFVHAELDLLDQRRFEEWIDLYTDDGVYFAPVAPDQASALDHVSLFYDDVPTMRLRATRLRHPRIHVQDPPSRTVHIVSSFRNFVQDDASGVTFRCNFVLFEYRQTQGQRLYGGTYTYKLRQEELRWRIAAKTAALVNSDDMFPSLAIWF